MKAMQCELCGSTEIIKDGDFFVCQSCGMKYTLESARKMMIEGVVQVEGTVKTDRSDDVERYMKLARTARQSCNYEDAEKYAAKILEIDLNNAEAWAIRSIAIDWQLSLGNDRLAESQAAFLEMYKLLREPDHDCDAIARNLALLVDCYAHLQKISKAEATLFTDPIKSHPNATSLAYIKKDLPRHLEFRKTQLEALETLCKILLNTADKVTSDNDLEEEKRTTLAKDGSEIRDTLSKQIPNSIGFMYEFAAKTINNAVVNGSDAWDKKWDKCNVFDYFGTDCKNFDESSERDAFNLCTNACDNYAEALKVAISFREKECVRTSIDKEVLEKNLFGTWNNLCDIEEANINHRTYRRYHNQFSSGGITDDGFRLSVDAKKIRKKKLEEYHEARDKYDPAIRAQKEIEGARQELKKKREAARRDFWASNQEMLHRLTGLDEPIAKLTAEIEELAYDAKSCLFFERKRREQLNQQIEEKQNQLTTLKREEGIITSAVNEYVESQVREEAAKVKELESKKYI